MRSNRSRRAFLGVFDTIGLAGIAGCADRLGSSRGATDVVLHNEGSGPRTAELIVTRRDGESPSIDTALELDPNSRETINNEVVMGDDYDVAVTVTGPTGNAPYTETQEWSGAGQPLHVILTDQIVFAVEIG